ncbi:hypothetical protein BDV28DRAFT_129517 [Aspergillus coremiiformis]|uniref:Uncharacterized protein n=1 Tax=Aspergillus coremiiformis TaxID=138285 RepID=A0A5N6ZC35_9EURO|nr:hypothetical protein BDV28DRAFT_129517 [Aspergillus coremiiformis]
MLPASCSPPISTDDGFIEESHRAGGPNLCGFPSVFCGTISVEECPMEDIWTIATKWDIKIITFYMGNFKPRFELSKEPTPTLRLRAPNKSKTHWLEAAREIYQRLCEDGLHIAVEILDESYDFLSNI